MGWWVGPERYGDAILTSVLLLGMLLRHWNVTAVYSLSAVGRDRRISLTTLFEGISTVAVTIILVLRFGLLGTAIGSIPGVVLVGLPVNLTAQARGVCVSTLRLVGDHWLWLWRFSLIRTPAIPMSDRWTPDSSPALVLSTLVAAFAYGALMLPFAFRDPLCLRQTAVT